MKVAQKRNAVQEGMFYFKKDIFKGKEWVVYVFTELTQRQYELRIKMPAYQTDCTVYPNSFPSRLQPATWLRLHSHPEWRRDYWGSWGVHSDEHWHDH